MNDLHIYNSLTRKKERFQPLNPPFVGMYVCGPTVYNEVHLGNCRTFVTFDVIYRYLMHLGYKVRYVRNITDVGHLENDADEGEDKIAKKARLEQLEPMEIVQRYTNSFHHVMQQFNLLPPNIEPTATGHLIEQIEWVENILQKGYAYEVNGSVYFDVEKYNRDYGNYGKLSGKILEELREGTRALEGQHEKRNPLDFALWKKASPSHIMRWRSPWGKGFPGWHLECSVMSTKYLGETFDIHGGGMDLKFPHHECEIAQAVAHYGKEPVRYWIHTNMLTVNGQKMSKSLGNAFLPNELFTGNHPLLEKAYSPMVVKFFMLQAHYGSTLDFSNEALQAAEKGFKRLMNAFEQLGNLEHPGNETPQNPEIDREINQLCDSCYDHMNDDFNTALVLADLFEIATKINALKNQVISPDSISHDTYTRMKTVFSTFIQDVFGLKEEGERMDKALIDGLVRLLIEIRAEARKRKDFATSDKIRDALKQLNIQLKDEKDGTTTWTFI